MPSRCATASIATRGTQALPVCRPICFCTSYSDGNHRTGLPARRILRAVAIDRAALLVELEMRGLGNAGFSPGRAVPDMVSCAAI